MAKSSDTVSWTGFNTVLTALLTLAIVVVGGGFTWTHGDLTELRTDVREIRGSVTTLGNRVQDTREDMLKAMSRLESQTSMTNVKLEELKDVTRQGR